MTTPPIILVPGFWLGAWAWDEVAVALRAEGHDVTDAAKEAHSWLAGLKEVRNITWVDLPTSHWPMWSRPKELAGIIGEVAKAHAADA